jgi:hypothetical protein
MHLCLDATILQIPDQVASVWHPDDEEIIEIIRGNPDRTNGVWQLLFVNGCNSPTLFDPRIKVTKFNAQDRGLDLVHAGRNLAPIP